MATKIEKLRATMSRARKERKQSEMMANVIEPVAGATYGFLKREGVYLPSIPKVGRHATTGMLALAVALNTRGRASEVAAAFGRAGLTLAAYELASTGQVVGDDGEEWEDAFSSEGEGDDDVTLEELDEDDGVEGIHDLGG